MKLSAALNQGCVRISFPTLGEREKEKSFGRHQMHASSKRKKITHTEKERDYYCLSCIRYFLHKRKKNNPLWQKKIDQKPPRRLIHSKEVSCSTSPHVQAQDHIIFFSLAKEGYTTKGKRYKSTRSP